MAIKKTEKKQAESKTVKVIRAHEFKSGDISFDAEVEGVKLYGMVYKDEDGEKIKKPFISFPSRKGSDDKYYNIYWFEVTDDMLADIEKQLEVMI